MNDLLTFVTTDYAGITRGRSIPVQDYLPGKSKSVGWVPANMSLTPFDQIADPNPWGSSGDLRLLGDENARYRVTLPGATTPTDMMMSWITELDGSPWALCP
ncbi:MAG: glutamine synthetase, partial [Tabrizicola sp.]|nr:glutamine synthetase [Tabrizicola sp.]